MHAMYLPDSVLRHTAGVSSQSRRKPSHNKANLAQEKRANIASMTKLPAAKCMRWLYTEG